MTVVPQRRLSSAPAGVSSPSPKSALQQQGLPPAPAPDAAAQHPQLQKSPEPAGPARSGDTSDLPIKKNQRLGWNTVTANAREACLSTSRCHHPVRESYWPPALSPGCTAAPHWSLAGARHCCSGGQVTTFAPAVTAAPKPLPPFLSRGF